MKRKNLKKKLIYYSLVVLIFSAIYSRGVLNDTTISDSNLLQEQFDDLLVTSNSSNLEILEAMFDAKNADYAMKGYYSQTYSDSLQATYYALFILEAVGKLDEIDQQAVIDYIMTFYNPNTDIFSDENSNRYFASKIPGRYFPLSTLLEVNCYAVLSLNILNSLDLIDVSNMIDFIWDCYHPILHGFIGQPYHGSLDEGFKVPTADNTYYAVITLDTIGVDWNFYSQERSDISTYVDGLQSLGSSTGFYNDEEGIFDSLMEPEPNQFASYYCIKTLETFGSSYVNFIDVSKFHEHLTALYHAEEGYFDLSSSIWVTNYSNIVATAMSLELTDITGFTSFTRNDVLSFIFDNRNYRGGWDASTTVKYHELIDTFQIIRSLSNTGDIAHLSLSDKNEISQFIALFSQEHGYSLLSEDYTSVELLYSVVSSYDYFGRIGELDIQEVYDLIIGTVVAYGGNYDFFTSTGMDLSKVGFRSKPFDYYTAGHHEFVEEINSISSHENVFKMLNLLNKISKLNDFASSYDLNIVLQDVIDSQFLNPSYPDNFGAFLVNNIMSSPEWKNDLVYLKYSYYAMQAMETISAHLGLGNITNLYFADLGFDKNALGTFIARNIVETPTELYFDVKYSNNEEISLENLYYTVYILNAIDQFSLNISKINNFVTNHLNYSNAKNLYYSFKISKFLDLNVDFDVVQTHSLVQSIYSDAYNEFYLTTDKIELEQDVFLWFCEIAKTDQIRLIATYNDTVRLGGTNLFAVELVNLVLSDFGQYTTVKLESIQLGNILLDEIGNNTYQKVVEVSANPSNYPTVQGKLCVYDGAIKKISNSFSFTTEFVFEFTNTTIKAESRIQVTINGSHMFMSGNEPISGGSMFANVYRNNTYVDFIDLITSHSLHSSIFAFDYSPMYFGNYSFKFYLNDPYFATPQSVYNETFDYEDPTPAPDPDPKFKFSYTVNKTESQILVSVIGYYLFPTGNEPVHGGSMHAEAFRDGNYVGTTFLSTYHGSNSSTFTFNSSPIYLGNYSFNFYFSDSYLASPRFICNVTLEYLDPNPNPSNPIPSPDPTPPPDLSPSSIINGPILAIIGLISSVTVVGVTVNVGNRVKKRRSRKDKNNKFANGDQKQGKNAHDVNEEIEQEPFEKWS